MQKFKRFLQATLVPKAFTEELLATVGARARWVPEELAPFDEVEIALPLTDEEDLTLTLAVENGGIARILFGAAAAGDDDADPRGLSEAELAAALERYGEAVVRLLDAVKDR